MPATAVNANVRSSPTRAGSSSRGCQDTLGAAWTVPAWIRRETGRWTACNGPARRLHARRTRDVDAALRQAELWLSQGAGARPAAITSSDGTSLEFLVLDLHDGAGRPAGMLVTAHPQPADAR